MNLVYGSVYRPMKETSEYNHISTIRLETKEYSKPFPCMLHLRQPLPQRSSIPSALGTMRIDFTRDLAILSNSSFTRLAGGVHRHFFPNST